MQSTYVYGYLDTLGRGTSLSAHFKNYEMACKHCDYLFININLITSLETLRELLNSAMPSIMGEYKIIPTNSYRCPIHNHNVGGRDNSTHIRGMAADIYSPGVSPAKVALYALSVERFANGGIAIYPNFTHVDVREYIWRQGYIAAPSSGYVEVSFDKLIEKQLDR